MWNPSGGLVSPCPAGFTPSDPNLVITGFGSPGQKLTAASKDDKYGIWQGTFIVP